MDKLISPLLNLTEADFERMERDSIARAEADPNQFPHWFAHVEQHGIPAPETLVIDLPMEIQKNIVNGDAVDEAMIAPILDAIMDFGKKHGFPLFLKNSLYSGKHHWNSHCCIPEGASRDVVFDHVTNITYSWACVGPSKALHLVVREMIPTAPVFHAHEGMPVTAEFRVFTQEGRMHGYQPYWPEHSVQNPSCEDWKERLQTISTPTQSEIDLMRDWSNKVVSSLGGDWSVDFLRDKDGNLFLIDMALASQSYFDAESYQKI